MLHEQLKNSGFLHCLTELKPKALKIQHLFHFRLSADPATVAETLAAPPSRCD